MKIHLLCQLFILASLRATPADSFSAVGADMIRQELIDHQVRVQNESFVWEPWLDWHTCLPAIGANFSDVTGQTPSGSFVTAGVTSSYNIILILPPRAKLSIFCCSPISESSTNISTAYLQLLRLRIASQKPPYLLRFCRVPFSLRVRSSFRGKCCKAGHGKAKRPCIGYILRRCWHL
jgi:hypothetical protein